MLRFPRTIVLAAIALLLAGLTLPSAADARVRPFKARWTGNANLTPTADPCIMRNDETGAGQATPLGPFTWQSVEFVDFCAVENGVAVEGNFTMTAASGDQVFGEYVTIGLANEEGNLDIVGLFRFTGGTGRFEDAEGGGLLQVTAFFASGLPFEGAFLGWIDF